jgi:hypothetical protein
LLHFVGPNQSASRLIWKAQALSSVIASGSETRSFRRGPQCVARPPLSGVYGGHIIVIKRLLSVARVGRLSAIARVAGLFGLPSGE